MQIVLKPQTEGVFLCRRLHSAAVALNTIMKLLLLMKEVPV